MRIVIRVQIEPSQVAEIKGILGKVIELLTQGNIHMGKIEDKVSALVTSESEASQAQMDLDKKILSAIENNQSAVRVLSEQHAADLAKIETANAEIADLKAQVDAGNNDPETLTKLDEAIQSNEAAIAKSKEQAVLIDGLNAFLSTVLPTDSVPISPVEPVKKPNL